MTSLSPRTFPALQTSGDSGLFDVRDDGPLGLWGYTRHDPTRICGYDTRVVIPFISNRNPMHFPYRDRAAGDRVDSERNYREVVIHVEPIYVDGPENSFVTWVCDPSTAVDLIDGQWICSIGRDRIQDFIHDVRRRMRDSDPGLQRMRASDYQYRRENIAPANIPPTPKPEEFIVYKGRRISFEE